MKELCSFFRFLYISRAPPMLLNKNVQDFTESPRISYTSVGTIFREIFARCKTPIFPHTRQKSIYYVTPLIRAQKRTKFSSGEINREFLQNIIGGKGCLAELGDFYCCLAPISEIFYCVSCPPSQKNRGEETELTVYAYERRRHFHFSFPSVTFDRKIFWQKQRETAKYNTPTSFRWR